MHTAFHMDTKHHWTAEKGTATRVVCTSFLHLSVPAYLPIPTTLQEKNTAQPNRTCSREEMVSSRVFVQRNQNDRADAIATGNTMLQTRCST
jgi:hypothetical protein